MDGEIVIYPPPRVGLPFVVAHVAGGKVTMVAAAWDRSEAHREAARAGGDVGRIERHELRKLPKLRGHR